MRKIDVFTHISPPGYSEGVERIAGGLKDIGKRTPRRPDAPRPRRPFPRHGAVPRVPAGAVAADAADRALRHTRTGHRTRAHRQRQHGRAGARSIPTTSSRFAAALPMNAPEAALVEAQRAVTELGAKGIQIYSNVLGKPIVSPEFLPLFEAMVGYDLPIWLHPYRGADFPDYLKEDASEFEIWWTFGWPYDTSAAMARVVFAGLFDRWPSLKIIAHHMGAMVPYFAGRVGPGWDQLGRTHLRSRSLAGAERAQEAAARLLQDVLRRHGVVRGVRGDGLWPGFLRRRPMCCLRRTRRSIRRRARCTSARRSRSSTACRSHRMTASGSTGAMRRRC